MMKYRLAVCEQCGNRHPIVWHDLIDKFWRVICEGCGAYTERAGSEQQAIEDWNSGKVKVEW